MLYVGRHAQSINHTPPCSPTVFERRAVSQKTLVNLVGNGHTGRVVEGLDERSRACALALWQALRASPYPPQGLSRARGRHSFWDTSLWYCFDEQ
jgi:hypothetical protein